MKGGSGFVKFVFSYGGSGEDDVQKFDNYTLNQLLGSCFPLLKEAMSMQYSRMLPDVQGQYNITMGNNFRLP